MYVLSFLFTLHISLSAYVNSTFLTKIVSERYVGILYTIASVITLILLSKSADILKYFGNRRLILLLLLANMISLTGLITSLHPYIVALSFICFTITNVLTFFSIDIFIEHFGNPATIGRTRGLYLTVTSLAWMISPLITASLIHKGGYVLIYVIAFIATAIMTIGLFFSVKTFEDKTYKKTPFLETYKYLRTNPHMLAVTIINFILQFFFASMVIYTSIYLYKHIGLTWNEIGVVFTIMLSPFVLFGLPIGILIDRYHVSKRKLLYVGFLIISIATLCIPFIDSKSLLIWASILFLTRTGASIIETTSEIYFFTHIQEQDAFLLGIYRDMTPMGYILAPLLATLTFVFLPFPYLFIILGLIIASGLYYIPQLKHTHEPTLSITNQ